MQYPFRCEDRSKIPDELLEGLFLLFGICFVALRCFKML